MLFLLFSACSLSVAAFGPPASAPATVSQSGTEYTLANGYVQVVFAATGLFILNNRGSVGRCCLAWVLPRQCSLALKRWCKTGTPRTRLRRSPRFPAAENTSRPYSHPNSIPKQPHNRASAWHTAQKFEGRFRGQR